jgi:hypothetical protein
VTALSAVMSWPWSRAGQGWCSAERTACPLLARSHLYKWHQIKGSYSRYNAAP